MEKVKGVKKEDEENKRSAKIESEISKFRLNVDELDKKIDSLIRRNNGD